MHRIHAEVDRHGRFDALSAVIRPAVTHARDRARQHVLPSTGEVREAEQQRAQANRHDRRELFLTNGFTYNNASQVISLTQSNTQYNYTEAQNRVGGYGVN